MLEASIIEPALKHLGNEFTEIAWTTGIATLLISPVTVLGNGLVLASILLDPFKNIRKSPSSYLIFSLALADLFFGVLASPLLAYWRLYTAINNSQAFSIKILHCTFAVSVGVSLYSLVALSVDRLIAITTPLQYTYRVTKRRIRIVNVFIWCCGIISGALAVLLDVFESVFYFYGAGQLVFVSIILVALNIAVIRSVHNQSLSIKRVVDSKNLVMLQNTFNREKAVTKTIVIVVVVFQICFLPYVIISSFINGMQKVTDLNDSSIILWIYFLFSTLVYANSLMNPFLYAWRLPKYKKAFQHFLIQLKKGLCLSSKKNLPTTFSPQFPITKNNQNTQASLTFSSLVKNKRNICCSSTRQARNSSDFKESTPQEHVLSNGTENTWL